MSLLNLLLEPRPDAKPREAAPPRREPLPDPPNSAPCPHDHDADPKREEECARPDVVPASEPESAVPLTDADIASFKALGAEVRFEHPEWGEFWLVPEYTQQDRLEITPEHIAKVSAALRTFGGKVIRFGRIPDELKVTAFSLAAARAHLRRLARRAVS